MTVNEEKELCWNGQEDHLLHEKMTDLIRANNEKLHDSVVQMHTIYIQLQGPDVSLRTHFITTSLLGDKLIWNFVSFSSSIKMYQDMKLIHLKSTFEFDRENT